VKREDVKREKNHESVKREAVKSERSRRAEEQKSSRAVVGVIQELQISSTNAYPIPIILTDTDNEYSISYCYKKFYLLQLGK